MGVGRWILLILALLMTGWFGLLFVHLSPMLFAADKITVTGDQVPVVTSEQIPNLRTARPVQMQKKTVEEVVPEAGNEEELDESYHIVFSTGCSEFQDWQSIGVYSSAIAVGQIGPITRIASGCTPEQEKSITHAMSHLPKRCRVHFAPNTEVIDHGGHVYKYANKPLGMMHWLNNANPAVPPTTTVALVDPDFFFLRPLWHDSFDSPEKYFASGASKKTPMPPRVQKGVMVAQRYGIGGTPWRTGPGKNKQKAWDLKGYLTSIGRPHSPALDPDLNERSADTWYSFGAPYIAVAEDWLPIATNWTGLMPMAVERNFGNLAEMYACSIAVADYGIRPVLIDSTMISNVHMVDEGWPWVDKIPMDRGCDPSAVTSSEFRLPNFLHYCQTYKIPEFQASHEANPGMAPNWKYSKYQVPDEILHCPAGSKAFEGGETKKSKGKAPGNMHLGPDGFLPDPPTVVKADSATQLRNNFMNCVATRGTNQAARDYRKWFCEADHS